MRHGARTRRAALTAALIAATTAASLTAGCTRHRSADDARAPARTPTPSAPATPTPVAGSPLAVKIDNVSAARPQTGLGAADVVYAEQVEGGLSRLMAVYATRLPKSVGPVRSARESDLELLRQFHEPTLAYSGAQRKLLPLIGRAAPHNLYVRPARLLPSAPGRTVLTTGFRYGPAPFGGSPAAARTVRYPAARFTFTWSEGRGGWLIAMDGTPATTTDGGRPAPPTVVVQYVRIRSSKYHDVLGNHTPYTETTGSGRAEVLRDGRSFDARWSRPAAADGTEFTTADGGPMNFADGQVWVVFAASSG
ncbi:DUF3048 domain-containing protein [Streptomyces sp. NPDC058145]|uniref:DUF3048 domain-containing protein n=1 Tax=Streptomyces sp. NPDC058145 TaxID=3346356 RepID=UPI0036ED64D3